VVNDILLLSLINMLETDERSWSISTNSPLRKHFSIFLQTDFLELWLVSVYIQSVYWLRCALDCVQKFIFQAGQILRILFQREVCFYFKVAVLLSIFSSSQSVHIQVQRRGYSAWLIVHGRFLWPPTPVCSPVCCLTGHLRLYPMDICIGYRNEVSSYHL